MIKNRKSSHIHCNHCPISSLCIANGLNSEEKEKINAIITQLHLIQSDEHLYFQNQKMQYIFALYSGRCKEYIVDEEGNEKIKGFFYSGDLLGLESLHSREYTSSVIALKTSQFCALPLDLFFQKLQESAALFHRFIYLLSHKLHRDKNIPRATNAKRRIAAFLLDMFYRPQTSKSEKHPIHLSMSQFDLANLLGLAHETVSRTLHTFQDEEIIKISKKDIYITNINSLKEIAHMGEST